MSDFLNSVKADLLDGACCRSWLWSGSRWWPPWPTPCSAGAARRRRPAATSTAPVAPGVAGIAVSQAPANPHAAGGRDHQRRLPPARRARAQPVHPAARGARRRPLPHPAPRPPARPRAASSRARARPRRAAGGTTPRHAQTDHAGKAKPTIVYHVAVLFGVAPAGTPPQSSQLTPYANLKRLDAAAPSKQPLLVFRGVVLPAARARPSRSSGEVDPARQRGLPAERRRSARRST